MLPSELHESITICLDFGVNLIGLRIGELIITNNNLNYISQDTRIPPYWSTKTLKTAAITHCSFFFFFCQNLSEGVRTTPNLRGEGPPYEKIGQEQ